MVFDPRWCPPPTGSSLAVSNGSSSSGTLLEPTDVGVGREIRGERREINERVCRLNEKKDKTTKAKRKKKSRTRTEKIEEAKATERIEIDKVENDDADRSRGKGREVEDIEDRRVKVDEADD